MGNILLLKMCVKALGWRLLAFTTLLICACGGAVTFVYTIFQFGDSPVGGNYYLADGASNSCNTDVGLSNHRPFRVKVEGDTSLSCTWRDRNKFSRLGLSLFAASIPMLGGYIILGFFLLIAQFVVTIIDGDDVRRSTMWCL